MKIRVIKNTVVFVLSTALCFFLALTTFLKHEQNELLWYFNVATIPPPDQRPWYMKGGSRLPIYNENIERNSYNLIFPEDYPNHDRIPQQLMLMPSPFNGISKI